MAKNEEEKIVTGLEEAADRKEAEYDLVKSLLSAMDYQEDEEEVTEAKVKRNGKFLFAVRLHPISDEQIRVCRKKATTYMKNPQGKNLPPIEKEFSSPRFKSLLIYTATVEEDQGKIWGNKAVMDKANLMQPYESVDVLLTAGEKGKLIDLIFEISGLNDDEGEEVDQEMFQ